MNERDHLKRKWFRYRLFKVLFMASYAALVLNRWIGMKAPETHLLHDAFYGILDITAFAMLLLSGAWLCFWKCPSCGSRFSMPISSLWLNQGCRKCGLEEGAPDIKDTHKKGFQKGAE